MRNANMIDMKKRTTNNNFQHTSNKKEESKHNIESDEVQVKKSLQSRSTPKKEGGGRGHHV